jgi:hypothetical protein
VMAPLFVDVKCTVTNANSPSCVRQTEANPQRFHRGQNNFKALNISYIFLKNNFEVQHSVKRYLDYYYSSSVASRSF